MKIIPVSDLKNRNILQEIISHLKSDGLLIYPTDTLYGIGCNFYSLNSQNKIDTLKGRKDIPYSVAIPGTEYIKDLTSGSMKLFNLFSSSGSFSKLTFLFKLNEKIDKKFVKNSNLIGIRLIEEGPLKDLLEIFSSPLITTSVNRTGEPPSDSLESIRDFAENSEYSDEIIIIESGSLPKSMGSTIIDVSGDVIKIIREGDNVSTIIETIRRNKKQSKSLT